MHIKILPLRRCVNQCCVYGGRNSSILIDAPPMECNLQG
nr:MAG TPA: hypothetical protein [Caudoviricetes sp.]